ncbi:hypothetical protein D9M70_330820 [compost metagenome]
MLLVDHDQRQRRQRCHHGHARAQHDAGLAAVSGQPLQAALLVGQAAVQHRQRQVREARGDAHLQLRRQVDFGNQHQHLGVRVALQQGLHGVQVDLGLAAAGDAVQQERSETLRFGDRLHRGALLVVQGGGRGRRLHRRGQQQRPGGAVGFDPAGSLPFGQPGRCRRAQRARIGQRQWHAGGGTFGQRLRQRPHAAGARRHGGQQVIHMRGQQAVLVGAGTLRQAWPAVGFAQRRRQRRQHDFAQAALVIARGKRGQRDPVGRQRWHPVQAPGHRTQPVGGHIGSGGALHGHADQAAAAKRHHHQVAGRHLGRREVVEAIVGRGIQGHADDRQCDGRVAQDGGGAAIVRHRTRPGARQLRNRWAWGGSKAGADAFVCGATST